MDMKQATFPDKVVLIGTYAAGEHFSCVFDSGLYQQMAANRVEGYYIEGLSHILNRRVDVLSALVTVPFPKARTFFVRGNQCTTESATVQNAGFLNIPYASLFFQTASLCALAKKWAGENKDKSVLVVVYAMRLPFLAAAQKIKRMIPSATVINIVPDLPEYMHFNQTLLRRLLSKANQSVLCKKQTCVDGFVLYAEKMKDALQIGDKPWIVTEGIFNAKPIAATKRDLEPTDQKQAGRTIVYTGGMEQEYGLDLLIEGFLLADIPSAELHLYGSGSYAKKVIEVQKQAPSVKYMGLVDSAEAYSAMCCADLLVNPRPSTADFTKYSCPSKVLEYLSTGVPVLMTRLGGIPSAYYSYAYTIEEETAEGLARSLQYVFSQSEAARMELGKRARAFILDKKNASTQVSRLLELAERIAAKKKARSN